MTGNKTTEAARVAGKNGFSLISDEKFRELYAALLQCRLLDDRLPPRAIYERWRGREACSAGIVACLRPGDSVTPTPRGLLAGYLQHASFPAVSRVIPGTTAQFAIATGDGLRHKLEKLGNIAVLFVGAGEPEQMRETFAAAAQQSLPVLYALESSTVVADMSGILPVIRVDGSDAVAVYRVAHESITRARQGGGPTIMECASWPIDAETNDPLEKLEHYLAGKKLFRRDWKQRLEKKYNKSLDDALRTAYGNGF